MNLSDGLVRSDLAVVTVHDVTCVHAIVDHECSDACGLFTVDDSPVDRGSSSILREKCCMKVECSQSRNLPYYLRQHAERHDNKQICLPGLKLFKKFRILQGYRLQYRDTVLYGIFLYRTFIYLESASAGLVWYGHDADYLVVVLDQCFKRCDGELRRTHVDDTCLLECVHYLGFDFLVCVFEVSDLKYRRIVNCLPCQVDAYRQKDICGYEHAAERIECAVLGQLCAGDVDDPVEHEEKYRYDGRRSESAFADECSDRCSYQEEYEAGDRKGELLENLNVYQAQDQDVVLGLPVEVYKHVLEFCGIGFCPFMRRYLRVDVLPRIISGEFVCSSLHSGGVQLKVVSQGPGRKDSACLLVSCLPVQSSERVLTVSELVQLHGFHLVVEPAAVRLLE